MSMSSAGFGRVDSVVGKWVKGSLRSSSLLFPRKRPAAEDITVLSAQTENQRHPPMPDQSMVLDCCLRVRDCCRFGSCAVIGQFRRAVSHPGMARTPELSGYYIGGALCCRVAFIILERVVCFYRMSPRAWPRARVCIYHVAIGRHC